MSTARTIRSRLWGVNNLSTTCEQPVNNLSTTCRRGVVHKFFTLYSHGYEQT